MNEIEMIPVGLLAHHPKNPRLNLGDLTELTESIRARGVMQNLTVVPDPDSSKYLVVIGNRRLEAGKLAGLAELPCVIDSRMDEKEQMATMLMENMQRQDLTVYEQAQGFQMMMDLGFKPDQIAEKTGISETTVRRRLKMAELDKEALKKACEAKDAERQITLADFEKLAQVDSLKERNALLKTIGDHNFDWSLRRALQIQKATANKPAVKKIIRDAGLKRLEKDSDRYSGAYEHDYKNDVHLYDWEPGKPLLPSIEGEVLYYMDDSTVSFYVKKKRKAPDPANRKTEAEKAEERRIAEAWEKLLQDWATARELRHAFVDQLRIKQGHWKRFLLRMMEAAVMLEADYQGARNQLEALLKFQSAPYGERARTAAENLENLPEEDLPKIILAFYEPDRGLEPFNDYRKSWPRYERKECLCRLYEWLGENGYPISETEQAIVEGTHESFQAGVL